MAKTVPGYLLKGAYHWESTAPDRIYMVQPAGRGQMQTFIWKQALDQARRTSKGKYVAPAPIESVLNNDPWVELSCVTGAGRVQPCPMRCSPWPRNSARRLALGRARPRSAQHSKPIMIRLPMTGTARRRG